MPARVDSVTPPALTGLLNAKVGPEETVARLLHDDPPRARRQVDMAAAGGSAATDTGDQTLSWSGGSARQKDAVQVNLLARPEMVDAMATAVGTTDGALPTVPGLVPGLVRAPPGN